ncbi:MAG TPA: bifunctional protein-serine/threonine kinase/phosphatase [Verrucomicrobiae bacterium]
MKTDITSFSAARKAGQPNQDACGAECWNDAVIAVVADGVGAAELAGEAAARVVSATMQNFCARPRTWSLPRALEEFTRLINRTLHQESMARTGRVEMVSTATIVAIEGTQLCGLNAGDSRAYRLRGDELRLLSRDHTEDGRDMGHVLTQAVGLQSDIAPHYFQCDIEQGDVILLCTDGVTVNVPEEDLREALQRGASGRNLVQSALERATPETLDDATAVVLRVRDTSHPGRVSLEIPDTLRAGTVIDGCELLEPFGQNERTWIARCDGAKVVMKFAPREARENETIRNQFVKELWSISRLQADYFTRAFVPEPNRTLCYCMEYIEAPTLKEFLRGGTLDAESAVTLMIFLLDAAQFLVRFDLTHGDLKPENILVWRENGMLRCKLIDFGSINEIFSVTTRAGTPSYLAPERFTGVPCSERTEVFALGVILHEVLTGEFPYGEIEPFQTPVFRAPRSPSARNALIPPWLEAVVLRAIAARPEQRYQSFSEMKFELENPTKVRPFFQHNAPLLERNPVLFYKIAFVLSLLLNAWLVWRLLFRN